MSDRNWGDASSVAGPSATLRFAQDDSPQAQVEKELAAPSKLDLRGVLSGQRELRPMVEVNRGSRGLLDLVGGYFGG
jgi:hypothetical protein